MGGKEAKTGDLMLSMFGCKLDILLAIHGKCSRLFVLGGGAGSACEVTRLSWSTASQVFLRGCSFPGS